MGFKVLDLFCGTGGFSQGFEVSGLGFQTIFGVDLLPVATQTFSLNHPNAFVVAGDIRKIKRNDIAGKLKAGNGKVDLIVGGPPCQGFSSIRPFRSSMEDDPRNSLFEEFASFVNFFRPPVFVLENVVGLATHNNGESIQQMEECFHGLGYETEWRILNAAHFGVPQKRERLILIGAERGSRICFPRSTHDSDSPTIGFRDKKRLHLPEMPSLFIEESKRLPKALTVMEAISDLPELEAGMEAVNYDKSPMNPYQEERRATIKALSLHNSTAHTKKMLEIISHSGKNISSIPKHLINSGFSSCYSRLAADEPAVTVTVNFVHPASNRCIHPQQNRALTPREGARLQSFDDSFRFAGNRTQVVKQIGNAVPPLLGRALAGAIASML
jgi:DNA (cytosine-5)-methyltransferase 1